MDVRVLAGPRMGSVRVPCSKSEAHRALIAAALSQRKCHIGGAETSKDILATVQCLNALGADIKQNEDGSFASHPISALSSCEKRLYPGESGSTLRFLLPLAGALGQSVCFEMEGRLPQRPMEALAEELIRHGMLLEKSGWTLACRGKLAPGVYTLPGNVSSQFVTGLLFALPLLTGDSELRVTGEMESFGYVRMTLKILSASGVRIGQNGSVFYIPGRQVYDMPPVWTLERDWSQAAFFLCMGALSKRGITLPDMNKDSAQGDKAVLDILARVGADILWTADGVTVRKNCLHGVEIDASPIPDLIPALSALLSVAEGETRVVNAKRLRLKESDRLESTRQMLSSLGTAIDAAGDSLLIRGKPFLAGGRTEAQGDHRIAMAAAVAASGAENDVIISGAQCTDKSYPRFWRDLERLEAEA